MNPNEHRSGERGLALLLVLMLLAMGSLLLTPALVFTNTGLMGKQIQTDVVEQQYCRDGAVEYALWQLLYVDVVALLVDVGDETNFTVELNGCTAEVLIRMQATLGDVTAPGAEGNRVRASKAVECDVDGDGIFGEAGEDCLGPLPAQGGIRARYTVVLEQVSPDLSVGMVAIYDELPSGFDWDPVADPVVSLDGSFPEIESVTPVDIQPGGEEIWKWDFSSAPIFFVDDEVKQFTFTADINASPGRYCNGLFLKMDTSPHEKGNKALAQVEVGPNPPAGCPGAGTEVTKFADQLILAPDVETVITYVSSVENKDDNTLIVDRIKDVLPHDGFEFCSPNFPPIDPLLSCDPPKYKIVDAPFDPQTDSFTDLTGYTDLPEPVQTFNATLERWELLWEPVSGWTISAAGSSGDTLVVRFQARVILENSGAFFNEIFSDVECPVPPPLNNEGVTSSAEYCSTYSWPTGGVVIPTYDVQATTGSITAQGNILIDWSGQFPTGGINSWHVN